MARSPVDPWLDYALDLLEARADARAHRTVDVTSPVIPIDPAGKPSKWATVNALDVLRHFGRLELD